MKLIDLCAHLGNLQEDGVICVREPWSMESEAIVATFTNDYRIPDTVLSEGYKYFLEVAVVHEILEHYLKTNPSLMQITNFIIFYAENDAFPELQV